MFGRVALLLLSLLCESQAATIGHSRSTDQIIQILADVVPPSGTEVSPKCLLSLLPKRYSFPQPRSSLLCKFQGAATSPSFEAYRYQSFGLERTQIPRQSTPVHAKQLGERGNGQSALRRHGNQDRKLRCSKPGRAQRLIVGARHGACRSSYPMTGAAGQDGSVGFQRATPMMCICTTRGALSMRER